MVLSRNESFIKTLRFYLICRHVWIDNAENVSNESIRAINEHYRSNQTYSKPQYGQEVKLSKDDLKLAYENLADSDSVIIPYMVVHTKNMILKSKGHFRRLFSSEL